MTLGRDVVDGIDHEVGPTQQCVGEALLEEQGHRLDRGLRIDRPEALGQDGGLWLAYIALQRLDLPIGIGIGCLIVASTI